MTGEQPALFAEIPDRVYPVERLRAFSDPEGEVYAAYSVDELVAELSESEYRPEDFTELTDDAILSNGETGEILSIGNELAAFTASLAGIPRTDARNRGIVALLWTQYG